MQFTMKRIELILVLLGLSVYCFSQAENAFQSSLQIIESADKLKSDGLYELALQKYKRVNRSDSNYYDALVKIAEIEFINHNYNKAIQCCKEGLSDYSGKTLNFYILLGKSYNKICMYDSALQVLEKGMHLFPNDDDIYFQAAFSSVARGNYAVAEQSYLYSIYNNPLRSDTYFELGKMYLKAGKPTRSVLYSTLAMALKTDSSSIKSYAFLNEMYTSANVLNDGQDCFPLTDQALSNPQGIRDREVIKIAHNEPVIHTIQWVLENMVISGFKPDELTVRLFRLLKLVSSSDKLKPFHYSILMSCQSKDLQKKAMDKEFEVKQFRQFLLSHLDSIRSYKKVKIQGVEKEYLHKYSSETGKIESIGNFKPDGYTKTGYWISFYPNGFKESEGLFEDDNMIGQWKYYSPNGFLYSVDHFVNNMRDGRRETYFADGKIRSVSNFKNGFEEGDQVGYYHCGVVKRKTSFQNGRLNGPVEEFYTNGKLFKKYGNLLGQAEGSYQTYFANGNVYYSFELINHIVEGGYVQNFFNGKPRIRGSYKNTERTGRWVYYYVNGAVRDSGMCENNNRVGIWNHFDHYGILRGSMNFSRYGLLDGNYFHYDYDKKMYYTTVNDRNKITEVIYYNKNGDEIHRQQIGSETTPAKGFFTDGAISHLGTYVYGEPNGEWQYFYRNGNLSKKETYQNGRTIGKSVEFYPFGKLFSETEFGDNNWQYVQYYWPNGNKKAEGAINGNDEKEGLWLYYYITGEISESVYFYDGYAIGFHSEYAPGGKKIFETKNNDEYTEYITYFDTLGIELLRNYLDSDDKQVEFTFKNGKPRCIYDLKCEKMEGNVTWYQTNGNVSSVVPYLNGIKSGLFKSFYSNGKLEEEGIYENGLKQGVWKTYFPDGSLKETGNYFNDEKDSVWTSFFDNGKISSTAEFKEGVVFGKLKYYDLSGLLAFQINFDEGGFESIQYEDEKGNLVVPVKINNDFIEVRTFYKSGKPSAILKFQNNILHGSQNLFYENGNPMCNLVYSNGSMHGTQKYFSSNASLEMYFNYQYGVIHGDFSYYNTQGKPVYNGKYHSGVKHGVFNYFKTNGTLDFTETWFGNYLID